MNSEQEGSSASDSTFSIPNLKNRLSLDSMANELENSEE